MLKMFAQFFSAFTKLFAAFEKLCSAGEHMATWVDESAALFADEASIGRQAKIKQLKLDAESAVIGNSTPALTAE